MAVKETKVKLKTEKMDKPQEFGLDHAQRILNMPKNGGWKLSDSNFILDKDGNIKRKS